MTLIGVYEDLKELDRIENPIEESLCYEEPVAE